MSTKLISVNRKLSAQKYNSTGVTPYQFIATDTYFNRNILLLHGDGTNNANNTVFVDSSINAFTVTTNGKPQQGTFSPFSQTGWSNYFDGTGDYLSIPNSAAFDFGTSTDFTVEGWIFPTTFSPGGGGASDGNSIIGTYPSSGTITGWSFGYSGNGYVGFSSWLNGTQQNISATTNPLTLNAWNHFAITRTGSTYRFFVNGTSCTFTGSITQNVSTGGNEIKIGALLYTTFYNYMTGYISNFRIIKGTALYTSDFTTPVSALTAVSNTSLLICQSNNNKDNSTNNFTITENGDVTVLPFSPFPPSSAYSNTTVGGSAYFNGSGDYLYSSSASTNLSSSWTVETWFYPLNTGSIIFDCRPSTTNGFYPEAAVQNSTHLSVYFNAVDNFVPYPGLKQWSHIALVKNGATNAFNVYVNGANVYYTSDSNTWAIGTNRPIIGANGYNPTLSYFNGYVSNARIINGTAQYTANFTPSTAPLTAVTNTRFLLNATNAGIIDHTAKNTLTTYGSGSKISTTQSKFGGASINQDGTNSYVFIPSSELFKFGSSDFTIECWVYVAATNTRTAFFSKSNSAGTTVPFLLEMTSAGLPQAIAQDGTSQKVITGTGNALTVNTWTHLALVRNVDTLKLYKDGTSIGTPQTMSGALVTSTDEIRIGVHKFGSSSVNFYIDDIRVTAGYARYTSNFTAPTSAFINQ